MEGDNNFFRDLGINPVYNDAFEWFKNPQQFIIYNS